MFALFKYNHTYIHFNILTLINITVNNRYHKKKGVNYSLMTQ